MSQKTWDALVGLCADICTRYRFRLNYTGDRNGSLTEHGMFASTACPGAWLHARMGKLASEVNERLDGGSTKSDSKSGGSDVYLVKVTCDALNIRKGPGTGYASSAVSAAGRRTPSWGPPATGAA
mgnify:CR=1 FL=1